MKHLSILSLILLAITFSSCENNNMVIWDIYPVTIQIYVQDSEGNDLLNEDTPNNILSDDFKITYKNEEYRLTSEDEDETLNRAYLAQFSGIELRSTIDGIYYLTFGEFDGTDDWNEFLYLDLGDGEINNINFKHDYNWIDGAPVITNEYYLNAQKQDSNKFYFTK